MLSDEDHKFNDLNHCSKLDMIQMHIAYPKLTPVIPILFTMLEKLYNQNHEKTGSVFGEG